MFWLLQLLLVVAVWHFSYAFAFVQEAPPPPPTFIEKHWWELCIIVFLIAVCFAHMEEDRGSGAIFYFLILLGYLGYLAIHYMRLAAFTPPG